MSSRDILQPLPGLREFFPEFWAEIDFVLSKMREVALRYNYQEYEGASLEPIELYQAKSGEALLGEVYHVYDSEDRHLVLRPEQTPTLAKMLARDQQRYPRPIRWFSIPRLFRDEGVQRGRTKEFWQLNADLLGEKSIAADAEIIALAVDIIRSTGVENRSFNVLVNHRSLLNSYLKSLGIEDTATVIQTIDRKMKFVQAWVIQDLIQKGMEESKARNESMVIRKLLNSSGSYLEELKEQVSDEYLSYLENLTSIEGEVMSSEFTKLGIDKATQSKITELTSIKGGKDEFFKMIESINFPKESQTAVDELRNLADFLEGFGVLDNVVFDLSLARGLDYYTGIVFEAFDASGDVVRALCGGGRYDDLVQVLGGQALSGVGFGMGDVALLEFVRKNSKSFEPEDYTVDIYIAPIKPAQGPAAIALAQKLRSEYRVMCNPFKWKMKKHLNAADRYGAKYSVIIGPRDLENGTCNLRKMEDGSSEDIELEKLPEYLNSLIA